MDAQHFGKELLIWLCNNSNIQAMETVRFIASFRVRGGQAGLKSPVVKKCEERHK